MSSVDDRFRDRFAELTRQRRDRDAADLQDGGGGGTSGGVTEDWKSDVNRQLEQLHKDVRALLNRGVAAVLGLAALIGGLYLHTDSKFDQLSERMRQSEIRQQASDDKIDRLETKLDGKLDLILSRSTAPPRTGKRG